ncbi:hypothetical protein HanIR_Chr05g0243021 [Helianthus annuus]|nr:hypothetical protein HanIR_Chr05g0243021 [Helianthus annuus]
MGEREREREYQSIIIASDVKKRFNWFKLNEFEVQVDKMILRVCLVWGNGMNKGME